MGQHIPHFISPLLESSKIRHGFFGRQGGVSSGDFSSLTGILRPGVPLEEVFENRLRIMGNLFSKSLPMMSVNQIHGTDVITIDKNLWELGQEPPADALVTNQPGIVLAVATADCVPLLFFDPISNVIGVSHAGWRGAFAGVIENTLTAMQSLGSQISNILVAIGPCIHQESYEVDINFYNTFMEHDFSSGSFFTPTNDRYLFDLPGYVRHRLVAAGIQQIDQIPYNTYAHPTIFFSCRRSYHQRAASFGCQLSVIGLV